jgi:hypothetical protein
VSAKVGGSNDDNNDDDYGSFGGGGGAKIGHHSPTSSARPRKTSTTSSHPRQTHAPSNNKNKAQHNDHDDLPACNGHDDPKAVLNLCVKVGAGKDPLVEAGATVLGENGTKVKAKVAGATVADVRLLLVLLPQSRTLLTLPLSPLRSRSTTRVSRPRSLVFSTSTLPVQARTPVVF